LERVNIGGKQQSSVVYFNEKLVIYFQDSGQRYQVLFSGGGLCVRQYEFVEILKNF
jgi:hypothetical protein